MIITNGRLFMLACLVLGSQSAPRIPDAEVTYSKSPEVDLKSDEILSSGFTSDTKTPRCGVVDDVEPNTGTRTKRWVPLGDIWTKKHLTYSITKHSDKLPDRNGVYRKIAEAFATWSKYVDLSFTLVSSEEADIVIKFESGAHDDLWPFDGPGGTLAHAFSPGDGQGGDVHFDDDEEWDLEKLYHVAVHEIGHSLGLSHSNVRDSTMFPFYSRNADGELGADDVAGIQARYGTKTSSSDVLCTDLSVDTVFSTPDGNVYAFKGERYWRVTKDGRADGSPGLISSRWKELPGDIDAAFTYNGRTFFFKGSTYWTYVGDRMVHHATEISRRFSGIPDDIDAATVWTGDGDIYFFKGSKYWRYRPKRRTRVSSDYPRPITDWRGIPGRLDAAVSFDGSTYFFQGQNIYEFDDQTFSVTSKGSQRIGPDFFGCRSQ